jgi:hypothetical protein
MKHHATKTCYIQLNKANHVADLPKLQAILYHERAHIAYFDAFYKDTLQYFIWKHKMTERNNSCWRRLLNRGEPVLDVRAWTYSDDETKNIAKKCWPYCRAYETRADIHAALYAPDHGARLIKHCHDDLVAEGDDGGETHPKQSERIKMLETVKTELDAAASADATALLK